MVYFEGLSVLIELIEGLASGIDIDIGKKRDNLVTSAGEGDTTTSTSASVSTSELA